MKPHPLSQKLLLLSQLRQSPWWQHLRLRLPLRLLLNNLILLLHLHQLLSQKLLHL